MSSVLRCDLCGRQMLSGREGRNFKVKELKKDRNVLFGEVFYWEKIDVHESCIQRLMQEIRRKERENNGDDPK